MNNALDLYARVWIGQIEQPFHMLRIFGRKSITDAKHFEKEREAIDTLFKLYFSELPVGASYGISAPETEENAKIAYDINQVVRNKIAWHNNPEGDYTVDFHEPSKTSATQELPKAEIKE